MKSYTKPSTEVLMLMHQEMLAASQGGVSEGSGAGKEFSGDDVTYNRQQHHGIGGGLWEDMK